MSTPPPRVCAALLLCTLMPQKTFTELHVRYCLFVSFSIYINSCCREIVWIIWFTNFELWSVYLYLPFTFKNHFYNVNVNILIVFYIQLHLYHMDSLDLSHQHEYFVLFVLFCFVLYLHKMYLLTEMKRNCSSRGWRRVKALTNRMLHTQHDGICKN